MNRGEMLEAAQLKYSSEQIQEETLWILQPGNETLLNLVTEFCQVRQDTMVTCFYERKPTSVGKLFGRRDMKVSNSKRPSRRGAIADNQDRITWSTRARPVLIHRAPLIKFHCPAIILI